MLRFAAAAVALLLTSTLVHADPCASIQYEELKDMSTDELTAEYCKAISMADSNTKEYLDMKLGGYGSSEARQAASNDGDACRNEADKIKRMIVRKGTPEDQASHKLFCKAQETKQSGK